MCVCVQFVMRANCDACIGWRIGTSARKFVQQDCVESTVWFNTTSPKKAKPLFIRARCLAAASQKASST